MTDRRKPRLHTIEPGIPYALTYADTSPTEALRCAVELLGSNGYRDVLLATFTSPQDRELPRQLGELTLGKYQGVVLVQIAIDGLHEGQVIALAGQLHDRIAGCEVRCVAVAAAPRSVDLAGAFSLNGFIGLRELPADAIGKAAA